MEKKYHFSEEIVKTIVVNAGGFLAPSKLDKLITDFEKEATVHAFTETSEANLFRIFNSIFEKGSFFTDCSRYPHFIETVTAIASYSNFLTDILVRNPEFIYLTLQDNFFSKQVTEEMLNIELEQGEKRHNDIKAFTEYLKFIQRKFIFKIGLKDILGFASLKETTEEISALAFGITSSLFNFVLSSVFANYNIPPIMQKHVIIALGKMGGKELNYSSDIDLIVFFDNNKKLQNGKEYFELLNQAIQLFTKHASEITNGGFLYRVDFRLRPDGKFSPLARTLNDTIIYYETRGELWEKQMLIKASFVTGNKELYKNFVHFKNRYVFGNLFNTSPLKTIKKMKYKIELNHNDDTNVKTFWGGIRDIEFSVQALQLINGYKNDLLKTPNTLEAMEELKREKIITNDEYTILSEAYIFFRKTEHFLQLLNNTQTHAIPNENTTIEKLSTYLNLNSAKNFRKALMQKRKNVRKVFNTIFEIEDNYPGYSFDKINFKNNKRAKKNIEYLRTGSGLSVEKSFDSKTIKLFEEIEQHLITYLLNSSSPDKVLENFVKFTLNSSFQSILYSELANKDFFNKLLMICEFSQIAVDLLRFDKSLIDLILSRKAFIEISQKNINEFSYIQFKFILALQYAVNLITEEDISQLLTSFFLFKLQSILKAQKIGYKYFVAALGSFGSEEMNFFSDIDLIVVVENHGNRKKMEEDFQLFLDNARNVLPNVEIDFRLRPEGKNSLLVWDLENYKKYLSERAEYWEFQTLFKMSLVCGNKKLFSDFTLLVIATLQNRKIHFTSGSIKLMHNKSIESPKRTGLGNINLKKSIGGFLTMDYIILSFIDRNIKIAAKIIGKNYSKKVEVLLNNFPQEKEQLKTLLTNHITLKRILLSMHNYYNKKGYTIVKDKTNVNGFAKFLGYDNFNIFQQEIIKITKINFKIFTEIVNYK